MKRVSFFPVIALAISCGSNASGPSSASNAQIAGVWQGTLTTTSVTGGECLGPFLQQAVGRSGPTTMTFTQNGSSVSATLTTSSGSLNYAKSVAQNVVTMSGSTCSGCDMTPTQCPDSNALRDVRIQTFAMNGTVAGNSLTATGSAMYNVFVAGTSSQVGTLMASNSFSLTRQ